MTPAEFISKWQSVELKESSASHSHFIDLCQLLDIEDPITADPRGEWFTFEKGATKTSGGEGWADVWRKDCFAWEYKGKRKDLDKAFQQIQQYAIALDNPPLLIVSDMDQIRIHTNWTNTVQKVYSIALGDLIYAGQRELLRHAFLEPERLKPAKTRQDVTEDAAKNFASLAQRLRNRGHNPHIVAHFVNRLIFCLFAEDVDLLPEKLFEKMLVVADRQPADFAKHATTLFGAMNKGGDVGFTRIAYFNGGLFDDDTALPLTKADISDLRAAASLDWSEIDPSILGTLFERGLDPSNRSQLGAHYTDREMIMQIVKPVVVEPLLAEWSGIRAQIEAKLAFAPRETKDKLLRGKELAAATRAYNEAKALYSQFLERLLNFRVLDPACGSGNFLYIALLELKNIEHRVNLDAEALGFDKAYPRVGPEAVLGIELNPYAAELARVSVWIGEIQWMRRNGFEAGRNPVLRSLNTIECRDAILVTDESGTPVMDHSGNPQRAEWPAAEVVVGNPPFLGNKKMIGELGETYTLALRRAWNTVPGGVDLVAYWFAMSWEMLSSGRVARAGLVSTNSIRSGANREVLKPIVDGGRIFEAWSDQPWFDEKGAAVRVSMTCFDKADGLGKLDGISVLKIHSNLKSGDSDLAVAKPLRENAACSFVGVILNGEGFELDGELARSMLNAPPNPNGRPNSDVLRPTLNGDDFNGERPDKWVIDFGVDLSETDAALYEQPFQRVLETVKPYRRRLNKDGTPAVRAKSEREIWWRHARARPNMRRALSGLSRYIATPMVTSYRNFGFLPATLLPDQKLVVFSKDDFTFLGILESKFHYAWTLATCSWIGSGNDITYAKLAVFETFPFPEGLTPDIPADRYADDPRAIKIATAAARLNEQRENWLVPQERTLGLLYSKSPAWLLNAHRALDDAVADAYGWGDEWRSGQLTDELILARLFHLNQARPSQ